MSENASATSIDITPTQPVKRRRLTPVVAGLAGAGVVLSAGGVFAASQLAPQSGDPEDLLPGNTFGVVKMDLDPSLGQKAQYVKLRAMLAAQNAKDGQGAAGRAEPALGSDPAVTLCRAAFSKLNCEMDVLPWLGQRFAAGAWPGAKDAKMPHAVLVIQTKDEEASRRALTAKYPGAVVRDGYVLLDADPRVRSTAALAQAITDHGTLATNQTYRADLAQQDGIASAWVDLNPFTSLAQQGMSAAERTSYADSLKALAGGKGKITGRLVAGLALVDGGFQLKVQTNGVPLDRMATGTTSVAELGSLPQNTVAGLSFGGLADAVKRGMQQDKVAAAQLNSEVKDVGLSFPRDLTRVLGSQSTLGVAALGGPSDPTFVARLKGADASLLNRIVDQLGGPKPQAPVSVSSSADTVTVAAGKVGAGQLTTNERFQRVMAGSDQVAFAAFLDLEAIRTQMKDADLAATGAVGVVGTVDQDAGRAQIQVTWNLLS